jgi:hypothetical protein
MQPLIFQEGKHGILGNTKYNIRVDRIKGNMLLLSKE